MNLRWLLFITLALLLTAILYYSALRTITFAAVGDLRAILGIISGFIGLIMIFIFPKISTRVSVITILLISLAVRLAVIPADTSDDVNRYLWEGKLYSQGISPYGDNAYHERFQPYQDQFWEKMNHRDKLTAYPPLAVRIFSIINKFSYTHLSYKVAFLTLDLFLIALLLATLYQYQRPLHWSLFYALSPISILSFAGEAHFDIIMVFFVAVSIFAFSKKWFILCGAAMGLAIASKIMVVILAPILLLRTGPKGIIAGIVACILPYALHFEDSFQMYQGLVNFGAKNNFNGLFNQIVVHSIRIPSVATKICGGTFLVLFLDSPLHRTKALVELGKLFYLCPPLLSCTFKLWAHRKLGTPSMGTYSVLPSLRYL